MKIAILRSTGCTVRKAPGREHRVRTLTWSKGELGVLDDAARRGGAPFLATVA